jgi:hypothetical protein
MARCNFIRLVAFFCLLGAGCKTADKAPSANQVAVVPGADGAVLVGKWLQGCIAAQSQSVLSSMTFNANGTWTSSVKMFADGSCASPVYEMITEGTYVTGQILAAGTAMDRTSTKVSEVFFLDSQITANNQAGYRGYRNWTKGVPFTRPAEIPVQYDIFRIEGDLLRLGKVSQVAGSANDGLTPQTRPTEISTQMKPLTRQ